MIMIMIMIIYLETEIIFRFPPLLSGTQVVLAANSSPALNDITHTEIEEVLVALAKIDPLIDRSLDSRLLYAVSTGSGSPCLNLLRVTEKCAKEAEVSLALG